MTTRRPHSSASRARLVAASGLVAALAHAPLALWLAEAWSDSHYSDVMLSMATLPIVAGLLFLRRAEVSALREPDAPHLGGLALAGLATAAALVALALDAAPILAISAPLAAHGLLIAASGARRAQPLLPALYALIFLIPATHPRLLASSHLLQEASAEVALRIQQALGYPSVREGIRLTTEHSINIVSESCSGMTTLTALLLFALVLAFLMRLRGWQLALSVAAILPLALLANGARIAFISVLHYHHGYDVAMGPLHDLSAYTVFLLAYLALFSLMRQLTWRSRAAQTTPQSQSHQAPVQL